MPYSGGVRTLSFLFLVSSLLHAQDVAEYLSLTPDQIKTFSVIDQEYYNWLVTQHPRVEQVEREITELNSVPEVDPLDLGVRYAELETIRRGIVERLNLKRSRLAAVFTASQNERLAVLAQALRLRSTVDSALSADLMRTEENRVALPYWIGPFREDDSGSVDANLSSLLQLSEEQYQALNKAFIEWVEVLIADGPRWDAEISAVCKAESASPLDPAAIGQARVKLRLHDRAATRDQTAWEATALSILGAGQKRQVQILEDARKASLYVRQAEGLGLIHHSLGESFDVTLHEETSPAFQRYWAFGAGLFENHPFCHQSKIVIKPTSVSNYRSLTMPWRLK